MADRIPGDASTRAKLTPDTPLTGKIDTVGDHDWYRVRLVAGQSYTFFTAQNGDAMDTTLALRDSAGNQLAFDDDSGPGLYSYLTFTATAGGTFYLDVGAYNTSIGTFDVTMTKSGGSGGDTVPGDVTTTARLALNEVVAGQIDTSGDHDWYRVRLVAGQTYDFSTAQNGTAMDTTLTLRDASGTQIAFDDDGGPDAYSLINFTATTTGTYYLDVGGYSTSTGSFDVTVVKSEPPEPLAVFTYDQIANQLTNDFWTYFGGSRRAFAVDPGGEVTVNVSKLTADGQFLAREALATWTDVTGITFREITGTAQIDFDDSDSGAYSSSTVSGATITSSIVNVSTDWIATYGTTLDTYSFQTYIHEIGHAIGLGHGSNYNGSASYPEDAGYANDAWNTTIMSYFSPTENTYFANQGFTYQFVGTPMVGDSVATTDLYGINTLTRTGNTVYGFNNTSGRAIYDAELYPEITYAVYDNGGKDSLNYSGFDDIQLIDLRQEMFSNVGGNVGNVIIARGTVIENAIGGSGADLIIGNAAKNSLTGGVGDDTLAGGGNADTLKGGAGADHFRFAAGDLGLTAARSDTVVDFTRGQDKLDFSGYDAVAGTDVVDEFSFIGRAAFSGTAGELRFTATDRKTTVSGDTDGDGTADFVLTLTGKVVLTETDFILSPDDARTSAGIPAIKAESNPWQNVDLRHGLVLARDAAALPGIEVEEIRPTVVSDRFDVSLLDVCLV